jgi:hypothetical protein
MPAKTAPAKLLAAAAAVLEKWCDGWHLTADVDVTIRLQSMTQAVSVVTWR